MSHRLKCWAEYFDAIVAGRKTCDVRHEDDRVFGVGEIVELTRTDREGKATEPQARLMVTISHIDRHAGALELLGEPGVAGASSGTKPIAVLSFSRDVRQFVQPAAPAAPAEGKAP
jgi:ASC-1-like (ASCH) protein